MSWADRLTIAGTFTTFFSGYLFLKGPAVNNAQLAFRVGLLSVGVILFLAGIVLKSTAGRNRD